MPRIEIVAISEKQIYSIGKVEVSHKGEVYFLPKIKQSKAHYSRHASGKTVFTADNRKSCIRTTRPIDDFKGIEDVGTTLIFSDNLNMFHEYKPTKNDGVFEIDLRKHGPTTFFVWTGILTEEGRSQFKEFYKEQPKRQARLFDNVRPMIGIIAFEVKPTKLYS
ncbi:MAG: hypothetical protein AB1626_00930 [Candidatus Micrarchaeota archaeon]